MLKQRDRQTDKHANRKESRRMESIHRESDRHIDKDMKTEIDAEGQMDKKRKTGGWKALREKETETDRQTDRDSDTETEREPHFY